MRPRRWAPRPQTKRPPSRPDGRRCDRSGDLQIAGRRLAGLAIRDEGIRDLLSLVETLYPGALDGADMHENILAAVIRLDEAKALRGVEPLHSSLRHETLLFRLRQTGQH